MKEVYCVVCHALIGYYPNGVKDTLVSHGKYCPYCRNQTHHDVAEKARQNECFRAFVDQLETKHSYVEKDHTGAAARMPHDDSRRDDYMVHQRTYVARSLAS